MKIGICSSSRDEIPNIYKESSTEVLNYLVTIPNIELNWGSASTSIMGICYETFKNNNLKINGYTTKKYLNDLDNLTYANHKIFDTTFDLKKNIFNDSDILLILPGGIGTISEVFSYIEEIRSNNPTKTLIIYNKNHHYDFLNNIFQKLVDEQFNDNNLYNYFKIITSIDELKVIIKG